MLFISGQVARPFESGTEMVGKDAFSRVRAPNGFPAGPLPIRPLATCYRAKAALHP